MLGSVAIRIVDAGITVLPADVRHTGRYRLIATLTDHRRYPARGITLYRRWCEGPPLRGSG